MVVIFAALVFTGAVLKGVRSQLEDFISKLRYKYTPQEDEASPSSDAWFYVEGTPTGRRPAPRYKFLADIRDVTHIRGSNCFDSYDSGDFFNIPEEELFLRNDQNMSATDDINQNPVGEGTSCKGNTCNTSIASSKSKQEPQAGSAQEVTEVSTQKQIDAKRKPRRVAFQPGIFHRCQPRQPHVRAKTLKKELEEAGAFMDEARQTDLNVGTEERDDTSKQSSVCRQSDKPAEATLANSESIDEACKENDAVSVGDAFHPEKSNDEGEDKCETYTLINNSLREESDNDKDETMNGKISEPETVDVVAGREGEQDQEIEVTDVEEEDDGAREALRNPDQPLYQEALSNTSIAAGSETTESNLADAGDFKEGPEVALDSAKLDLQGSISATGDSENQNEGSRVEDLTSLHHRRGDKPRVRHRSQKIVEETAVLIQSPLAINSELNHVEPDFVEIEKISRLSVQSETKECSPSKGEQFPAETPKAPGIPGDEVQGSVRECEGNLEVEVENDPKKVKLSSVKKNILDGTKVHQLCDNRYVYEDISFSLDNIVAKFDHADIDPMEQGQVKKDDPAAESKRGYNEPEHPWVNGTPPGRALAEAVAQSPKLNIRDTSLFERTSRNTSCPSDYVNRGSQVDASNQKCASLDDKERLASDPLQNLYLDGLICTDSTAKVQMSNLCRHQPCPLAPNSDDVTVMYVEKLQRRDLARRQLRERIARAEVELASINEELRRAEERLLRLKEEVERARAECETTDHALEEEESLYREAILHACRSEERARELESQGRAFELDLQALKRREWKTDVMLRAARGEIKLLEHRIEKEQVLQAEQRDRRLRDKHRQCRSTALKVNTLCALVVLQFILTLIIALWRV